MERRRVCDRTEGEEGKKPEYERQLKGETEGQRGEEKCRVKERKTKKSEEKRTSPSSFQSNQIKGGGGSPLRIICFF